MKLWKGATFAFMLCGAALSTILIRNMATVGQFKPKTIHPSTSSSSSRPAPSSESRPLSTSAAWSSSSSSSSAESTELSQQMGGLQRRTRSAEKRNSLFSEFSMMFQSFTEGELQHVVGTLLDRKRRKNRRLDDKTRRTKRARRPKPCSLRKLETTVTELGLGYQSDEALMLRYCSGKCTAQRQSYDLIMKHMADEGFRKKGRKDKVSDAPCCRPTAFEEDFSFFDGHQFHTIHNMSAKKCGCV